MKVLGSIRAIYEEQEAKCFRLKDAVDRKITGVKDVRWHYESRVKDIQSFALKIESGRYRDPGTLEDFFACTLVVANTSEVDLAEQLILDNFSFEARRPDSKNETHKHANAFPFDDLRLYVSMPETQTRPSTDLTGIVFEVQIKTFLQHAWSIATHDLIYKSDDANWAKERIAYQIKAMLEHAEVSIQEAELLSACSVLDKEDKSTKKIKSGIAMLKKQWPSSELPKDIRRLAQNITQLLDLLKIDVSRLETILDAGKQARGGVHPLNLSPYAAILQYLFVAEKVKIQCLLEKDSQKKGKQGVLVPREIDIPTDIDQSLLKSAIFIGEAI